MRPSNYAFEMPLRELRTAELLLVATLRLYAVSRHGHARLDWCAGLRAAGLNGAPIEAFSDFFGAIRATERRKLDVGCPHCQVLGPDEGLFLQLIAALQRGRIQQAAAVLADWTASDTPARTLVPIRVFADALAQAGLIIPPRHGGLSLPLLADQSGRAFMH